MLVSLHSDIETVKAVLCYTWINYTGCSTLNRVMQVVHLRTDVTGAVGGLWDVGVHGCRCQCLKLAPIVQWLFNIYRLTEVRG